VTAVALAALLAGALGTEEVSEVASVVIEAVLEALHAGALGRHEVVSEVVRQDLVDPAWVDRHGSEDRRVTMMDLLVKVTDLQEKGPRVAPEGVEVGEVGSEVIEVVFEEALGVPREEALEDHQEASKVGQEDREDSDREDLEAFRGDQAASKGAQEDLEDSDQGWTEAFDPEWT